MKRFTLNISLIFIFAAAFNTICVAQGTSKSDEPKPELLAEAKAITHEPSFAGGYDALEIYLSENLKYPEKARRMGTEGTVLVEYYINPDGTIEDITVNRSVSKEIDQEAIRLVKNMPSWVPAVQNNHPVKVKYSLPISFQLTF